MKLKNNKSLIVNAILNSVRQVFTILFPLITLPYASRVLQTENYGKINFATSFISYFSILAALGVSAYAVREGASIRDNKKFIDKFSREVFSINILSTVIAYILLLITIIISKKVQQYEILILIYAIGIILTTIGVEWVFTIYEDFLFVTIRTIAVQLVSLIAMFLFIKNESDFYIYAVINVIANGGANIFSLIYSRKYVDLKITLSMNLRKHLAPLIILLGNAIAMVIYVNSDITILGFLADDYSIGVYSVAVKIYTGVKQLLNAIMTVSIPRIAIYVSEKNKDNYNKFVSKLLFSLLVFLLPIMVGLFCLSEELVIIVAGETYKAGSVALRILSIALAFSIGAGFYSYAVLITNKRESDVLKSTMIAAIINVALNFVCIQMWSQNGAAITTTIAEIVVFILCLRYSKDYCDIKIIRKDLVSIIFGTLSVVVTCICCKFWVHNIFVRVGLCVIISAVIYFLILFAFKNTLLSHAIQKHKSNSRND